MPSRRDEETIEPISPIIADRGERKAITSAPEKRVKPAAKPVSGSASGATKIMLIVAVVGILGLAAWIAELQKQLQASSNLLITYQENMEALENRLSITDESVLQSEGQMGAKVKELDNEIRKLWDNVWKKTKQELAKHEKALANHNGRITTQSVIITNNQKAIKSQSADLKNQLGANQIAISALDEQLSVVDENSVSIAQLKSQITGLGQSLAAVKKSAGGLSSEQQTLLKRVNELDEWIDSFNGYRREVNQKLLRLESPSVAN